MIPWYFEYAPNSNSTEIIYVTVLQKFKQHYTGLTMYRVREESSVGWVAEHIYGEAYIRNMLNNRVEGSS